jgi:quinohemoprotein ethanol dehydrogenase
MKSLDFEATTAQITHGRQLLERYCGKCHWGVAEIPNLTFSKPEIFDVFPQIVGRGAFLKKGMPNFGDRLSEQDVLDIKNYVLSDAKNKITKQTIGASN